MIRLQRNSIEKIKRDFRDHLLYTVISNSFPHAISGRYALSAEQTFVEVVNLLDILKEKQEDIQWDDLYNYLQDECLRSCEDVSDKELHAVASVIIVTLAAVLLYSPFGIYKKIGKSLLQQYDHQNTIDEQRQKINRMAAGLDTHMKSICFWMQEYMQSAEFLSIALEKYAEQETPAKLNHRFKYLKSNVPEEIVIEIDKELRNAAAVSRGAGDAFRSLFRKYNDYILLPTSAENLHAELRAYYGYDKTVQTTRTFYK